MSTMREALLKLAEKRGAQSYVQAVSRLPPNLVGLQGRVREILISPVKSFAMMSRQCVDVAATGLKIAGTRYADRQVMFVRHKPGVIDGVAYEYERFSQREAPFLVLAQQQYSGGRLILESPSMQSLEMDSAELVSRPGDVCNVLMSKQSKEIVRCVRGLHSLTLWVRALIGQHDPVFPVHEVFAVARPYLDVRWVDQQHACGLDAQTEFSDGGMITVASQESLDLANAERAGMRSITSRALRMNIVFEGLPAYAEDFVDRMLIRPKAGNPLALRFGGLCVRCSVPCVDPDNTDKPVDTEFLGWLAKNRPPRPDLNLQKGSGATFGVNCAPELKGRCSYINVGDEVEILSEKW